MTVAPSPEAIAAYSQYLPNRVRDGVRATVASTRTGCICLSRLRHAGMCFSGAHQSSLWPYGVKYSAQLSPHRRASSGCLRVWFVCSTRRTYERADAMSVRSAGS